MATILRNFEPGAVWSMSDGKPSERALGWMRSLYDYIYAPTTWTVTGAFACNGATAQTSAAVSAAISGTAGAAYTAAEQGLINNTVTLVNQLRAALVANGIAI